MANYNYLESIKSDINDYLEENKELLGLDRDELEEKLNEDLWINDSVTGNASGSYTFCRETAKEYVIDNMDLVTEIADEFGIDNSTLGEKFRDEEWEYFDVSIRCYLLGQAISEVLESLDNEDC